MTEEEIKKAMPEKTKSIDLLQFADPAEINPIYDDKPYVLVAQKGSEKAYALLIDLLKKSKKVGIAHDMMQNRGPIGVIKPYKSASLIDQLRYKNEGLSLSDQSLPEKQKITQKEVEIALQLIHPMTAPFNPEDFKDVYTEQTKAILKQKLKGKKVAPKEVKTKTPSKKIHAIVSLLKASLEGKKPGKPQKRKTA